MPPATLLRVAILWLVLLGGLPAEAAESVLRWSAQGDALTLDPHGQNEGLTLSISRQIYEPLIYKGDQMGLEPGLATAWRLLEPTVWELQIRRGVTFHDGSAFTASDAAFSINRALKPTSDMRGYLSGVTGAVAVSDHILHIATDGPNPILPYLLTEIGIMSEAWSRKHGVEAPQDPASQEEAHTVRHAMGTGPYVLALREADIRTHYIRNPDWWGLAELDHTPVERIEFTPIGNPATRIAALLSGRLDFVLDTPVQDIPRLRRTPGLKVEQVPENRTIFLGLNAGAEVLRTSNIQDRNPLADIRVREALYRAIDITAIQRVVMRGQAAPAGMLISPGNNGYDPKLDSRLDHDPAAARRLLAAAGYPDGFSVQLDCPNDRYQNDEAICQALIGMMARIGVELIPDFRPKSLHFPKIERRESDMYLLGWSVPTLDSHYAFVYLLHSEGSWNATNYGDPALDSLIAAIGVETDMDARDALIAEAWTRVRAAMNYLPLHHQMLSWSMVERLSLPIRPDNRPHFFNARFD